MKRELNKLSRELDQHVLDGELIADFHLKEKVLAIVRAWITSHEKTRYCPLDGPEFDCYLVPSKKVNRLI